MDETPLINPRSGRPVPEGYVINPKTKSGIARAPGHQIEGGARFGPDALQIKKAIQRIGNLEIHDPETDQLTHFIPVPTANEWAIWNIYKVGIQRAWDAATAKFIADKTDGLQTQKIELSSEEGAERVTEHVYEWLQELDPENADHLFQSFTEFSKGRSD